MIGMLRDLKEVRFAMDKCLDAQLWNACAGGMVQIPPLNSTVFYFPQGHVEHAHANVELCQTRVPSLVPCRVSGIRYLADAETDEVYAKIRLVPLSNGDSVCVDGGVVDDSGECQDQKLASFAKTLTQSDANNGGGFSVPRYCAETIFPRLDYSAEPPVQNILAKDVHGEVWKFRHIFRGTPRRHLLTTGWSNFVNNKRLVAGDSIVFLRSENDDLCVGVRRAKRGMGGGSECASGWSSFGGYSGLMKEDESRLGRKNAGGVIKGKVRAESVLEAANLAANGQPFEVIYYPRAGTPEFFVKASAVRAAMQIQWCPGMRFKMAFETEDSSRISWFMGTISSVQVADPINWPNSPWRILLVAWDEPDLLQNVTRVSPWLVELVSNMPGIHLSPFSPPRKKMRLPQAPDFSLIGQLPIPAFTGNPLRLNNPLCCVSDNLPAGIQRARHAQFGPSAQDLHFNRAQSDVFPVGFPQLNHAAFLSRIHDHNFMQRVANNTGVASFLPKANPAHVPKENSAAKAPHFLLFGQLIHTNRQSSQSCSGDTNGNSSSYGNPDKVVTVSDGSGSALHQYGPMENSSDGGSPWYKDSHNTDLGLETGHCKDFMKSDDFSQTLDLSNPGSSEQLYGKLASRFHLENSRILNNVL